MTGRLFVTRRQNFVGPPASTAGASKRLASAGGTDRRGPSKPTDLYGLQKKFPGRLDGQSRQTLKARPRKRSAGQRRAAYRAARRSTGSARGVHHLSPMRMPDGHGITAVVHCVGTEVASERAPVKLIWYRGEGAQPYATWALKRRGRVGRKASLRLLGDAE